MVQRHYGTNMVDAGVSRKPMGLTGTIFNRVGLATATPGTTEAVLATLPIPGGAINGKGKGIHVRAIFSVGAAGSSKTFNLRYGSISGTTLFNSGSTANSTNPLLDAYIFLTDDVGGWETYGWLLMGAAIAGGGRVTGSDDIIDDWNLIITGTSPGAAGDVILRAARVDLIVEGGVA